MKKPDAYGPFWIAATLVFMIGVCSNVAGWLNVSPKTSVEQATAAVAAYDGDVTKLTGALTLVAFFAIAMPVGMWGLARALGFALCQVSKVANATLFDFFPKQASTVRVLTL